ncbi:hypothetical protein [Treponema sp. R6D11]
MKAVVDELKKINENICEILELIKQSRKTKIEQIFDNACAFVGILGIISLIDIILKWLLGG